jgi:hypothetical protein
MGARKAGSENVTMPAQLVRYKAGRKIMMIHDERDAVADSYFWAHSGRER